MILPEIDEPVRHEAGTRNLWIRNRLLHSRFDPERELQRFLKASLDSLPDRTPVLLLGAGGLFEMLLPCAERLDLCLYEPIRSLRIDYSGLIPPLNLVGPEIPDAGRFKHVIVLPAYRRMFPEWFAQVEKGIGQSIPNPVGPAVSNARTSSAEKDEQGQTTDRETSLDARTQNHFLRTWVRNYGMRLDREELAFFESIDPVPETLLFCGAGPRLVQDLGEIEIREGMRNPHALFVAVADTAAAAVIEAGWKIDLIISVDSGAGTSYHLGSVPVPERAHLPVLTWIPGSSFIERAGFRAVFVPTLFPLDQWLSAALPLPEAWINPFRNVLGYGFALQRRCGIRNLALAGCGFREEHGTYYARGTGHCLFQNLAAHRLLPMEQQDQRLTKRQRGANQKAAELLSREEPAAMHTSSQKRPSGTPSGSTEIRSSFTLKTRTFTGTQLKNRLGAGNLSHSLGMEYGPIWEEIVRRHLFFCD